MKKVDVYNTDYTKLNHSYICIFEAYEKLIQCDDADEEVLAVMESVLRVMNPALDRIKSEMTVKTRFVDGSSDSSAVSKNKSSAGKSSDDADGFVFQGNFGN